MIGRHRRQTSPTCSSFQLPEQKTCLDLGQLATSKIAPRGNDHHPWALGVWAQAERDFRDGRYKPRLPPRFPVILTLDGPVSSPAALQQLAELDSLPETIDTSQVRWDGTEVKNVTICHVSLDEKDKIEEKAETFNGGDEHLLVMFRGKQRFALIVTALKKGVQQGRRGMEVKRIGGATSKVI
ncbi:hypothetical protein N658DRAFT_452596 [Parathielavia hyrcaniae]|uniref:Uncharacterized protein n=1 Tax=Parathielavia hyrcaniae TaxID=113614 RepID=A0AAN6PXY3_9PEZI|nr:hypothetical protein N658DRAFT_452596 [Parathielavia hyrcaniae]